MRISAFLVILAVAIISARSAEVELARGGTVKGWVIVRTGWGQQPVVTVAMEGRQWQFDLIDVRRTTAVEEDRVLCTRKRDLRERASENSKSVALVFPGFEFKVVKDEGAWLEVQGLSTTDAGYIPKEATSREIRFSTSSPEPAGQPSDATPPADATPSQPPKSATPEKAPGK